MHLKQYKVLNICQIPTILVIFVKICEITIVYIFCVTSSSVKTPSKRHMSSLHMVVIQCSRQLTVSVSILADAQSKLCNSQYLIYNHECCHTQRDYFVLTASKTNG